MVVRFTVPGADADIFGGLVQEVDAAVEVGMRFDTPGSRSSPRGIGDVRCGEGGSGDDDKMGSKRDFPRCNDGVSTVSAAISRSNDTRLRLARLNAEPNSKSNSVSTVPASSAGLLSTPASEMYRPSCPAEVFWDRSSSGSSITSRS